MTKAIQKSVNQYIRVPNKQLKLIKCNKGLHNQLSCQNFTLETQPIIHMLSLSNSKIIPHTTGQIEDVEIETCIKLSFHPSTN